MTQGRQALWIIIPALCLGLGIVIYGWPQLREQIAPSQEPAAQTPAAQTPARQSMEAQRPQNPLTPTFDIVRVEPNGDLVVAGRAGQGAQIALLLDGQVWDRAQADANGQFALTPSRISDASSWRSVVIVTTLVYATRISGQSATRFRCWSRSLGQ